MRNKDLRNCTYYLKFKRKYLKFYKDSSNLLITIFLIRNFITLAIFQLAQDDAAATAAQQLQAAVLISNCWGNRED